MDSGASIYNLISFKLFNAIKRKLRPKLLRLKKPIPLNSFTGKHALSGDICFFASPMIDGRDCPTWFLFCDTGSYEVIVGRKFFKYAKALIDCTHRRLVWQDD